MITNVCGSSLLKHSCASCVLSLCPIFLKAGVRWGGEGDRLEPWAVERYVYLMERRGDRPRGEEEGWRIVQFLS